MTARVSPEQELKLLALDDEVLDELWRQESIGGWPVLARHHEQQRNAYYDTPDTGLRAQGAGLRWRVRAGEPMGELTLKTGRERADSIFSRTELTTELPANADPLRDAPDSEPLVEAERLAGGKLQQMLVLETNRRTMQLERNGHRLELALDIVALPGTPYQDHELEAELQEGTRADLEQLKATLLATGRFQPTQYGKRGRALRYLARRPSQPVF